MIVVALFALLQPLACHIVADDWIHGRDLALAIPALSALAPDVKIGLAPIPGQQRLFRISELKRLAQLNQLDGAISEDVCFSWSMAVPDRDHMLSAMRTTLADRNPHIELLESSLAEAPPGEMVFPLSGLSASSERAVTWRGYIRYAEKRQFSIWARVIVTVKEQHVIAALDLHPGDAIGPAQVKTESYEGPLRRDKYLTDAAQAQNMVVRRPVASGTALLDEMLETPREVQRGDFVNATVTNGAASLEVLGVAENAGRRGDVITVRNPRSGSCFRARVEDKGKVIVVPGGPVGLVVESKKS